MSTVDPNVPFTIQEAELKLAALDDRAITLGVVSNKVALDRNEETSFIFKVDCTKTNPHTNIVKMRKRVPAVGDLTHEIEHREMAEYQLLKAFRYFHPRGEGSADYTPYSYLVMVEHLPDCITMEEYIRRPSADMRYIRTIFEGLGKWLRAFQDYTRVLLTNPHWNQNLEGLPTVRLTQENYGDPILETIENSPYLWNWVAAHSNTEPAVALERAFANFRKCIKLDLEVPLDRTVVHGSFGLDNILIQDPSLHGTGETPTTVLVVDWKTGAIGNGDEDVAHMVQDLVKFWMVNSTVLSLTAMEFIHAFLRGYAPLVGFNPPLRVTSRIGGRLIKLGQHLQSLQPQSKMCPAGLWEYGDIVAQGGDLMIAGHLNDTEWLRRQQAWGGFTSRLP
ncbi:hypothetical protein OQA88_5975 [Cercophora sp. LCS_1]